MWIIQQVQKSNWKEKSVSFTTPKTELVSEKVFCLQNHIRKCFYTVGHWTKLNVNQKTNIIETKFGNVTTILYYITLAWQSQEHEYCQKYGSLAI